MFQSTSIKDANCINNFIYTLFKDVVSLVIYQINFNPIHNTVSRVSESRQSPVTRSLPFPGHAHSSSWHSRIIILFFSGDAIQQSVCFCHFESLCREPKILSFICIIQDIRWMFYDAEICQDPASEVLTSWL